MEETKVLNANNRNVEPIPDINTDSKPDKKKGDDSTFPKWECGYRNYLYQ